jgi:hypothetical protein
MLIEKVHETRINIAPDQMYLGIDDVVMDILKTDFAGTCRDNSLIIRIIKIIERSLCQVSKSELDGSGFVNVRYLSEDLVYQVGDILPACEIVMMEKNHRIMCSYGKQTMVWIDGGRELQSLRSQQKIPVIVKKVRYPLRNITVNTKLFEYPKTFIIFKLIDAPFTDEQAAIIESQAQALYAANEKMQQGNKRVLKFLANTFYPYSQSKNMDFDKFPKGIGMASLEKIISPKNIPAAPVALFSHPWIERTTGGIMMASSGAIDHGVTELLAMNIPFDVITDTTARVLSQLIREQINFVNMMNEMMEVFPNEESLDAQKNIWNLYKSNKIQL